MGQTKLQSYGLSRRTNHTDQINCKIKPNYHHHHPSLSNQIRHSNKLSSIIDCQKRTKCHLPPLITKLKQTKEPNSKDPSSTCSFFQTQSPPQSNQVQLIIIYQISRTKHQMFSSIIISNNLHPIISNILLVAQMKRNKTSMAQCC